MKNAFKKLISLALMITVVVIIPVTASGAGENDFSYSLSASIKDGTLSVEVNVDAPSAATNKNSFLWCNLNLNGINLGAPQNAKGNNELMSSSLGDVIWATNPITMDVLIFANNQTSGFDGGLQTFILEYAVDGLDIKAENSLKMIPVTMGANTVIGMWEGSQVSTSKDELAVCTFGESSEGNTFSVPDSSITNSTNNAATVTGTVSDGTATLNVASEKACVVAYTTDDGVTYNRLTATANSESGYDFVVPDYSEDMKFVVGLSGDADGDGSVGTSDYTAIARSLLLPENGRYQALSAVNSVFADADGDGTVGTSDYTAIARSLLLESNARYAAIEWK